MQTREEAPANGTGHHDTLGTKRMRDHRPVWQLVNKNIYLHRERKRQDEDDIMICQCKPIWATDTTSIGCGESCLNRMLNIECHPKYCPCAERCSNQSFTKKHYAKLEVKRAGLKGFGLFAKEDLKAGQFLIEYVGEVLEEDEYLRRKSFFAASGQRHFYFMNIGNGEVIDASRKGGLGRFINHSCKPNCETQKWVVRGELAIGLFTLEDVPGGTELTFDYNFERYGDRPMKCLCGTSVCRGFIGGTQESGRAEKLDLAPLPEEEDLEPLMVTERETDKDVAAILDRVIGLGWEEGWKDRYDVKLERLTASKTRGGRGKGKKEVHTSEETNNLSKKASARQGSRLKIARSQEMDPDWYEDSENYHQETGSDGKGDGAQGIGKTRGPSGLSISKRSSSSTILGAMQWMTAPRRRSEIDRRLDEFLSSSGRLKDSSERSVVKLLRLFNLCDIGPTVKKSEVNNAWKPPMKGENALNNPGDAQVRELQQDAASGSSIEQEEGELESPSPWTDRSPSTSNIAAEKASNYRHGVDPISASGKSNGPAQGLRHNLDGGDEPLSGRQRARIADMSLLLDVVLKTGMPSVKRALVKCGILQQLLGCFGRNLGEQYAVILRKALRTVEVLPCSADDFRLARSAHGSFADFLKLLTSHSDYEVRNKAAMIMRKNQIAFRSGSGDLRPSPAGAFSSRNYLSSSMVPSNKSRSALWDRDRGIDSDYEHGIYRRSYERLGGESRWTGNGSLSSDDWHRQRLGTGDGTNQNVGSDSPFSSTAPPPPPPAPPVSRERLHKRSRSTYEGDYDASDATRYSRNHSDSSYYRRKQDVDEETNHGGWRKSDDTNRRLAGLEQEHYHGTFVNRGKGVDEVNERRTDHWDHGGGAGDVGGTRLANGSVPYDEGDGTPFAYNGFKHATDDDQVDAVWSLPATMPEEGEALESREDLERRGRPGPGVERPSLDVLTRDSYGGRASGNVSDADNVNERLCDHRESHQKINKSSKTTGVQHQEAASWDSPNGGFQAFVSELVRRRVGKYEQRDHPARLTREEASKLFKQMVKEIVAKEHEAFRERCRSGIAKPIERAKLEPRIKEFVRDSVRRYHQRNASS